MALMRFVRNWTRREGHASAALFGDNQFGALLLFLHQRECGARFHLIIEK
ncbi:hypothetical protein [Rhizobium sp. NXC24]|nr:hypothetical protein [Rhizobium sp. NXC24]